MANKLLLIGGGGHCKSLLDTVLTSYNFDEIGIIEKEFGDYASVLGVPVIGCDAELPELYSKGWNHAFITVGSLVDSIARRRIALQLKKIGFDFPVIIDRSAVVSNNAVIGRGTFVGKGAIINVGVTIGENAIINTGAILEHDCKVGDFTHIAGRSILSGMVHIGDDSFIGAGSVIKQGIKIGNRVVVGMGSNVLQDIVDNSFAYGNPCKVHEK